MTPESPWLRFFAGLLCAAIVLRLVVDLLRPVIPVIVGAAALYVVIVTVHWWRER